MDKQYIINMLNEVIDLIKEDDKVEKILPTSDNIRKKIVELARSYIGKVKYVYGGKDLNTGVDCSGFTQLIYRMSGVNVPQYWVNSKNQREWGQKTILPKEGDLVCYDGHVAIYTGNGKIVDSGSSSSGVSERSVNIKPIIEYRNVVGD